MGPFHFACFLLSATLSTQEPAPAKEPVKGYVPPSTWIATNTKELTVTPGTTTAAGEFEFVNPTDTAVEFRQLDPSCTCTKLAVHVGDRLYRVATKPVAILRVESTPDGEKTTQVPSIPIGPRERGTFALDLEFASGETEKSVMLAVHCTEPSAPMIQMSLKAMRGRTLVVEPQEIALGLVEPKSTHPFTVTVRSTLDRDFKVLDEGKLPPNVSAAWERSIVDGKVLWTLKGTYVATAPAGSRDASVGDTRLEFLTDLDGERNFRVTIQARIGKPVEATPSFVSLGQIRVGKGATAPIRLVRPDGQKLTVTKVRLENLSLPEDSVTATFREDGTAVVVDLAIAESARRGLARGELVISTDHPAAAEVRVSFNGFVR